MKKLFILVFFIAFSAKSMAQEKENILKVDTVKNAIKIEYAVNNITNDTCYQIGWASLTMERRTEVPVQFIVRFYNRVGTIILEKNYLISPEIINNWGKDDTIIDDEILKQTNKKRRN